MLNMRLNLLMVLGLFSMMITAAYASSYLGVAFPKVTPSHVTMYLNDSILVNYTFTLYNGTAGTTYPGIPNSPQLAADGVFTSVAPISGVPPFSGLMTIYTKANTTPGNYSVQLAGGGQDTTTHGIAIVYLTVLNTEKPVTSVTTTIPANSTTSHSTVPTTIVTTLTTIPQAGSALNTNYIVIAIVIVIIIVIIASVLVYSKRRY